MSDFPAAQTLTEWDFTGIFGKLPSFVSDKIKGYQLAHQRLTPREKELAILEMTKAVCEKALPVSGPARHPVWEAGWGENLKAFDMSLSGPELARPRYYNKSPIVRWGGDLWRAVSEDYEYNMLKVIQHYAFVTHFTTVNDVFEFGCGTGHNLFRVAEVNPNATLHGFDWAESAVEFINLLKKKRKINASASQFDFFNPPSGKHLPEGSGVYTVAALEQVGENFGPWLEYILAQKPKVVVHIEPISEILKPDWSLLDYLCVRYFEKRNYLKGYLPRLQQLERDGKIKIHEVRRTFVGSHFIEGYTLISWSPCS